VDGEHEHVGADLGLLAEPVGVLIPAAGGDAPEVQLRVGCLRPALQVAGRLDVDPDARARLHVEVIAALAPRVRPPERGRDEELGEHHANGVVARN
jgi:hypothetical protein